MVGFGTNPPERPHHASSSCPDSPAPCNWSTFSDPGPNAHVLKGALVGGPRQPDDHYIDRRDDYVMNEVTLDYNAGYQSLLAGIISLSC